MAEINIEEITSKFGMNNPYLLTMGVSCKKCGRKGDIIDFIKKKNPISRRCPECGAVSSKQVNMKGFNIPDEAKKMLCPRCHRRWKPNMMKEIECECGSCIFDTLPGDKSWAKLMSEII